MIRLLFTVLTLWSFACFAGPGDTTKVFSHDETHWDWNGNFYDTVQFPPPGTYSKVIMHYELGCPSIGCSEWDYTTTIQLMDISDPNAIDRYELAKVITPYAGDKQQGWFHEYKFDVTGFTPLLTGEKVINAKYGGWQNGFTVSIWFDFIEGTPPMDPLSVHQVYLGSYTYGNASNPINGNLQYEEIDPVTGAENFQFKVAATGHGFGNNNNTGVNPDNCAEFCDKWFKLRVNNAVRYQQTVWRNDCGDEAHIAQTGTWIYNRAGWCPGGEAEEFVYDFTENLPDNQSTFGIELEWENYTATNVNMSYIISGIVFQYGAINHSLDAEVSDVLRPTTYDRYSRYNPTGENPLIIIKNLGSDVLNTAEIRYGVTGGKEYRVSWQGNLGFLETDTVELVIPSHNFYVSPANEFYASIENPNGGVDEVAHNNTFTTHYTIPDVYNSRMVLEVKSNNRGNENRYLLATSDNDTLVWRDNLANNTTYVDTIEAVPGAYFFYIEDDGSGGGGDGLSWWANPNQGTGSAKLINVNVPGSTPPLFIHNIESDFGNFYRYNFTIGYDLDEGDPSLDDPSWLPPNAITSVSKKVDNAGLSIYPNPSSDVLQIHLQNRQEGTELVIYSQMGAEVMRKTVPATADYLERIDVSAWTNGIYIVQLVNDNEIKTRKFVKQ